MWCSRGHTTVQNCKQYLAHRINHLYFLLEQWQNQSCLSRWGWHIIHCLIMIVLHYHTKKWSYICSEHFSYRHGGSKKEEKGEKKCRRRKQKKKEIKRERLCIFIYIKSIISYRYKGPRSGVSQSFMYNRRSNSTDSLSLCCDDAGRLALWEQ